MGLKARTTTPNLLKSIDALKAQARDLIAAQPKIKQAEAEIRRLQAELRALREHDREQALLRRREVSLGTADPNGYAAVVRRLRRRPSSRTKRPRGGGEG